MPKWPIRVKLIAGFSLVVGMMLILMGGSIFGLHSFHASNLSLDGLLRELGASRDLLESVYELEAPRGTTEQERLDLDRKVEEAQEALRAYSMEFKTNSTRGNRANSGLAELRLVFLMDSDLATIRNQLRPQANFEPMLPGTKSYLASEEPKTSVPLGSVDGPAARIARLNHTSNRLPIKLHQDFYEVLVASRKQYQASRVIVWTSALMVLVMLCGLAALFHRWVLYPVRLLQRGVRRVARGSFDYKIDLHTGDEMQALAEAFNDMTARLSVTYADLERQVQERSKQLVRSERLASVGFLAAGVAHEINNPLASIAFCSEALETRLGTLLDPADGSDAKVVRNYLRMIQEEAFRCKSITEKLLDFSRCADIQRERTDLAGLIQGVVEMVQHMGKYRGKHVVFQPKEAVTALVDSQEIKQVVLNLVVNALDSMESGGTLWIELRETEGRAEMTFSDEGCGMTPDVLENIFEPFFTKRRVGKGTGLGLSITQRIISQHRGEITATSPGADQGSTFIVRLPVRSAADDATPVTKTTRAAQGFHEDRRQAPGHAAELGLMEETRVMDKAHQHGLRILFADDEAPLRELMQMELPRLGHEVTVCPDGAAALKALEKGTFDAALLDMRMPGLTGIEVLGKIRQISPETQVIILTGHATVDTAVQALRLGAFDYLTKPCKWAELEVILNRVCERRDMANKATALETRLKAAEGSPTLIGETPAMMQVRRLIDTIAPTDATVMILGETGTGKELVARSLHEKSRRSESAFIPVNCGALPENLVESELFGHRRGAFTGADRDRKGLFEVANGGTLFLDEVGELDKSIQVKLLRFLESGEIRRLGENDPFRVDVRVLCATHRDLHEMTASEQFREDLFFRLNTFEIHLPSLRERRSDIPFLARHMLTRYAARRRGMTESTLSPESLETLQAHDWPGNIRELANAIERATILAGGGPIRPEHLPTQIPGRRPIGAASIPSAVAGPHFQVPDGTPTLRDIEMKYIQVVLEKHNGNKPAASKELGISLKTLYNKINQLQQS